MRRAPRLGLAAVAASGLALCGLGPTSAQAAPYPPAPASPAPSPSPADGGDRTLRGHTFLRPVLEDSAFIGTTIGFRQGVLYIDAGQVTGDGATRSVGMAAALESLDTTVQVLDWMAVTAAGDLQLLVGTSDVALFSNENKVAAGLRVGPAFKLWRSEATGTQIALRPYHHASFGAIVDVSHVLPELDERLATELDRPAASASEAIRRGQALRDEVLASSVTPLRQSAWGGTLHLAQSLGPLLGVQSAYELRRERLTGSFYDLLRAVRDDLSITSIVNRLAASVSFDASPIGVPVGASFEVSGALETYGSDDVDESLDPVATLFLGPGLYYTGQRSLQFGFFAGAQYGLNRIATPYGPSDRPTAYYGQFTLRHYF